MIRSIMHAGEEWLNASDLREATPTLLDALEEMHVGLQTHLERWGDHEGRLVALLKLIDDTLPSRREA